MSVTGTKQMVSKRDPLWEEKSGLLAFLSGIEREVERFRHSLGFNLRVLPPAPEGIDNRKDHVRDMGFLIIRDNPLMPERRYCLFSILKGKLLHGYIGYYDNGNVYTLRELGYIAEFKRAELTLWDWLRALLKASCDKI